MPRLDLEAVHVWGKGTEVGNQHLEYGKSIDHRVLKGLDSVSKWLAPKLGDQRSAFWVWVKEAWVICSSELGRL